MKLLYLKDMTWELDFIQKELLPFIPNLETEFFTKENFKFLLQRNNIIGKNIIAVNSICSTKDIKEVAQFLKPVAIFYLSDEYGDHAGTSVLSKHTKLFFRQYNFSHYNYSKNNYQIPLGYSKGFLNGISSNNVNRKAINNRDFNCSFIGENKSDRLEMSNAFKEKMKKSNIIFVNNSWDISNLQYTPKQCFDIYNNSVFVLCGRGNKSLNCFRIYEALTAGAIPVIVGSEKEINTTFNFNNKIPPFIFSNTWKDAVIKCNKLLQNHTNLKKKQNEILKWWNNELLFYRKLLKSVIKPINNEIIQSNEEFIKNIIKQNKKEVIQNAITLLDEEIKKKIITPKEGEIIKNVLQLSNTNSIK
jgi:hypothetical protein